VGVCVAGLAAAVDRGGFSVSKFDNQSGRRWVCHMAHTIAVTRGAAGFSFTVCRIRW
jgi:hypothetical protein